MLIKIYQYREVIHLLIRNYNLKFTSYIEEILTFTLLIQHILKPLKLGTYNSMYLKMRICDHK